MTTNGDTKMTAVLSDLASARTEKLPSLFGYLEYPLPLGNCTDDEIATAPSTCHVGNG